MNSHTDTRVTDYALGELDDDARQAIEAELAADEALRCEVAEIEKLSGLLRQATANELPEPASTTPSVQQAVAAHLATAPTATPPRSTSPAAWWTLAASIAVLATGVGATSWLQRGEQPAMVMHVDRSTASSTPDSAESLPSPYWMSDDVEHHSAPNITVPKFEIDGQKMFAREGTSFAASVPEGTLGDSLRTAPGYDDGKLVGGSETFRGRWSPGRVNMGSGPIVSYENDITPNSSSQFQLGNGGTVGGLAGNVTNGGTLTFDRTSTVTLGAPPPQNYGGIISGNGNLGLISGAVVVGNGAPLDGAVMAGTISKQGSGSLNVTGSNTYTGVTTIAAGSRLSIGNGDAAGKMNTYTGGTTISSGTVTFAGQAFAPSTPSPIVHNPTPQSGGFSAMGGALDLNGRISREQETGRFMLGVGVNSNAGLVGSIITDQSQGPPTTVGMLSPGNVGNKPNVPATVLGPWDVDNDGDGNPERIWIDLGLPITLNGEARVVKPLAAFIVADLEGRMSEVANDPAMRGLYETRLKEARNIQARYGEQEFNTEAYDAIVENPFLKTLDAPLSTFSIDVDTASYSNVRRFLNDGQLPPRGAVRLEEFVNYFTYDYPQPTGDDPFAVTTEAARCPWNGDHVLVRVGLKGKEIHRRERPASNLVFLVDVSGSMQAENKLPLVRQSLKLLVNELGDSDRVAMVVYAGNSGLVLPSTGGHRKQTIGDAIDRLEAGGSTNGASGITLAYQVAAENFIEGGVNRVVLATDGDFNVGITDQSELVKLIEQKAKSGVFFSALGYGMGNLKDSTLEKLADKGNGNYAYIDTLNEARKVLVEQMSGTLVTIAKDVKIQIEFNPGRVAAYRLLGYENRVLAAQDFNDDKKDAGEIGAGHTVTALYELIPAGPAAAKETDKLPEVDPLKYQKPLEQATLTDAANTAELLTLKLRYKQPDDDTSKLIERPLADDVRSYAQASGDFKFAASVAAFGMLLRESQHRGSATFDAVLELAEEGRGADESGYRAEFIELVRKAKALKGASR